MGNSAENIEALKSIAEILNQSLHLEEALHQSLEVILKILGMPTAWVFFAKSNSETYRLVAYENLPPGLSEDKQVWCGGCQCNRLASTGKLNGAVNIVRCSRLEMAEGDTGNLVYHASVPLGTPRKHIGIFNIAARDGGTFKEEELDLLSAVGNQMGVAIERALLFEDLREQRIREQSALLRLSKALLDVRSPQEVAEEIATKSISVFRADACLLVLGKCDGHQLTIEHTVQRGLDNQKLDALLRPFLEGPARELLAPSAQSCHLSLSVEKKPKIYTFPLEERHLTEVNPMIEDESLWQVWQSLGYQSLFLAPIKSVADGCTLGMLAVIHRKARKPATDGHLTELFANQAALAIEQVTLQEMRQDRRTLERELTMARDIQKGFLPKLSPRLTGWEFASRYESAKHVGGDFYDFIPLARGNLGIAVADVSGKGVPAALIMAVSKTVLKAISGHENTPLDAVVETNRILLKEIRSDRFLSLFYGELDPRTGRFVYVRAGHNPPLVWRRQSGRIETLEGAGMVLGVADMEVFEERTTQLDKGDVLLLFTDGLTEAMTADDRMYSDERLERTLSETAHLDAESIAAVIQQDITKFRGGAPPNDDLTMIVVKRRMEG